MLRNHKSKRRDNQAPVSMPHRTIKSRRSISRKMSNVNEFHGSISSALLVDHLQFMQGQEVDYKISVDYLLSSSSSSATITAEDRHVLCLWSYQMIESLFSKLSREISCIGISYLDRFMATSSERAQVALISRYEYQLAMVACMVIALKNRGGVKLDTTFVADVMCQNIYTTNELDAMEMEVLQALSWRLNGPSPHEFINGLVRLLPSIAFYGDGSDESPLLLLSEHSKIRVETAILDYELALQSSLSLAYAALLTSLSNRSVLEGFHSTDLINWMSNITSIMAGTRADRIFISSLEEIIETTWFSSNFDDKDDDDSAHADKVYNEKDDDNNNDNEAIIFTGSVQSQMRIRSLSWSAGDFEHHLSTAIHDLVEIEE
jgi:hypothetical protein